MKIYFSCIFAFTFCLVFHFFVWLFPLFSFFTLLFIFSQLISNHIWYMIYFCADISNYCFFNFFSLFICQLFFLLSFTFIFVYNSIIYFIRESPSLCIYSPACFLKAHNDYSLCLKNYL